MNKKTLIATIALTLLVGVGALGLSSVYADNSSNLPPMLQALVERFNLNPDEVQNFFQEQKEAKRAEYQAALEEKLNAAEYREARKLAQEAGKLAMHAKRGKSFEKIEVYEEECTTDADCKEDEFCDAGECEEIEEGETLTAQAEEDAAKEAERAAEE